MVEKALKQLEHQLTCHICLDRYTRPRTLPCLHSFCHDCLVGLPVDGDHCITCPVCRQSIRQPHNGVAGYQCAFLINSFLELHQLLEKVSGSKQNTCENCDSEQATGYCKDCSMFYCQTCVDAHSKLKRFASHQLLGVDEVAATASKLVPLKEQPTMECTSHGKPLEVYCDTCDKLICHLCTIKHHRDHECDAIIDAFPRHKQQIVDRLQKVKENVSAITTAVETLKVQKGEFLEQIQAVRKEIKATAQQLMELLKESERQLMSELDQVSDAFVEKVSAVQKQADISTTHLKGSEDFTEEQLRVGSQQEILMMKRQMVDRIETVCSQLKESDLLVQEAKLKFVRSTSVIEACHGLGSVVACSLGESTHEMTSFNVCNAVLNIPLSPDLVSSQISPVADPTQVFKCVVQQVAPRSFEVRYPPSTSGLYQLTAQVGTTTILDMPLRVEAMPLKRKEGQKFKCSRAGGICLSREGHLIVTEWNKSSITIYSTTSGKKITRFGQSDSKPRNPAGIALLQDGNIIVIDNGNCCLQVFTAEGVFVSAVGSEGSQPLQFKNPWDVAVDQTGKIYVTDRGNNRVQVLNSDLTYSHSFGSKGSQPGGFNYADGILVDNEGMVYVADVNGRRIQKFTPNGDILTVMDRKGEKGDALKQPVGLCFDNNNILHVTDLDDSLYVHYLWKVSRLCWQW